MDGTTLRVANLASEEDLERVRDALDAIGVDYEHVDSEPEDSYPQTAYFQIGSDLADEVENVLGRLAERHGFEAEVL